MSQPGEFNPYEAPAAEVGPEREPGGWLVRLRWVPALVCYFYGGMAVISSLASFAMAAYIGVRLGPGALPEGPRFAKTAPTPLNLLGFSCLLMVGVVGWSAGRWWRGRRWGRAVGGMALMFALIGIFAMLREAAGPGPG